MGCGSSTDSVKSESKASLGTAASSRASSHTRTPTLRNKAAVAPEVLVCKGTESVGKGQTDNQSTDSGIESAKTAEECRRHVEAAEIINNEPGTTSSNLVNQVCEKSVAFDVALEDGLTSSIVRRHPPRRLKKLEHSPRPMLTLEEIEKKQEKSATRRKKVLEKKTQSSKQSSRRRNELLAAVKFSQEHRQQVTAKKLDEKIDSASKNREKCQADTIRKQKIRESKAREAQKRRLRASLDDQDYDVEKDETFNVDDDIDSWLDGDNNVATTPFKGSASTTASERIYNGRSSPAKRMHGGSADHRLRILQDMESDESDTEAFSAHKTVQVTKGIQKDDFFD